MEVALRLENGRTVCERCLLAETALARMRGLLGRRELVREEGILLRPASSIHMAFMRFPIDALFLDGDGRVLKIARDLKPWKMSSARRSKAVVELASGEAARRGVEVGQRVLEDAN
jgi:hypothetical protein